MSLWIRLCNHTYIHTYRGFSLENVKCECKLALSKSARASGEHTHDLRSHAQIKLRNSWDQSGLFDPLFSPIYKLWMLCLI